MSRTGSLTWFARHECRLAWRDWVAMMTAGRRRRLRTLAVTLAIFAIGMHALAYPIVKGFVEGGATEDRRTLVTLTGMLLLSWSLMTSQAMESVTRGFYARSDLDLILSSPINPQRLFFVRTVTMTVATVLMALVLTAPFINILAALGGSRWLSAYAVIATMSLSAMGFSIALVVALFRTLGPKRARLMTQVVAAVIGAAFVIGLQLGAIQSYGNLSRMNFLGSAAVLAIAPDDGSIIYWPARAIFGDFTALLAVLGLGIGMLGAAILFLAPRFGEYAVAAAGTPMRAARQRPSASGFRRLTAKQALRQKEWRLLWRDPWLMSQSLMQILYLAPPAFLLWHSFSNGGDASSILVPVVVMAAGQLAGGLAWLAISGEDAPDLIATAPVTARQARFAKTEAVIGIIGIVFFPFIAALAYFSPARAAIAALGIIAAASASTQIQIWFRAQAKRGHFRRRQTSSRIATFAEAFSSISWAGTAALATAGSLLALIPGIFAIAVLLGSRLIRPLDTAARF